MRLAEVLLGLAAVVSLKSLKTASAVAPSGPPQNVRAFPQSSTTIRVEWADVPEEERNGALTQYEVLYTQTDFPSIPTSNSELIDATLEDIYTLTGLEEYVEYNIRVRAHNNEGPGPYSSSISAVTFQDVPSSPPVNFTVSPTARTQLTLTWNKPQEVDINGEILFYSIRYHIVDTNHFNFTQALGEDAKMFVLNGLDNFTEYELFISAVTVNGSGPQIGYVAKTSENVPEAPPTNVTLSAVSYSSLHLTWQPPDQAEWNGVLRGYQVDYYYQATPAIIIVLQISSENETSYTVKDLSASTTYCMSIAAVTVGPGTFSTTLCLATLNSGGNVNETDNESGGTSSVHSLTPSPSPSGDGNEVTGAGTSGVVVITVSVVVGVLSVVGVVLGAGLIVCVRRHRSGYQPRNSTRYYKNLSATNPRLVFSGQTHPTTTTTSSEHIRDRDIYFTNPDIDTELETVDLHGNPSYINNAHTHTQHTTQPLSFTTQPRNFTTAHSSESAPRLLIADNPQYSTISYRHTPQVHSEGCTNPMESSREASSTSRSDDEHRYRNSERDGGYSYPYSSFSTVSPVRGTLPTPNMLDEEMKTESPYATVN